MNICIFCKKVPEMAVCPAGRERKFEGAPIYGVACRSYNKNYTENRQGMPSLRVALKEPLPTPPRHPL